MTPTPDPWDCRCPTPDIDPDGACHNCRRLIITPQLAKKHRGRR